MERLELWEACRIACHWGDQRGGGEWNLQNSLPLERMERRRQRTEWDSAFRARERLSQLAAWRMPKEGCAGGRSSPRKAVPLGGGGGGGSPVPGGPPCSCPPPGACLDSERREVEALRAELEAERARAQEVRRRAALEARELRESAERERQALANQLRSKWEQQRAREVHQLREASSRQREAEIRHLLRWKEAELRQALDLVLRERDATMRQARELQRQLAEELVGRGYSRGGPGGMNSECRAKLQEVMGKLRWEVDSEQAVRIRHFKAQLELERSLFLKYIIQRFDGDVIAICARQSNAPQSAKTICPRPRSLESLFSRTSATSVGTASRSRSMHDNLSVASVEEGNPPIQKSMEEGNPPIQKSVEEGNHLIQKSAEEETQKSMEEVMQKNPGMQKTNEKAGIPNEVPKMEDSPPEGKIGMQVSAGEGVTPMADLTQTPDWLSGNDYNQLVKQNTELLNALADLEHRCTHLKDENALLRRTSFPEMQDKVKRLKRKNAELASIAKRLEERAKNLQESSRRIGATPIPFALNQSEGNLVNSNQAVDLGSDANILVAKNPQLEAVQKESRELHVKRGGGKENAYVLGIGDFECLLRESQKEVLRLQRQIVLKNQSVQVLKLGSNVASSSVIMQEISSTTDVSVEDPLSEKGKLEMSSALVNGTELEPSPLGSGEGGEKKAETKGDYQVLKKQLVENIKLCDQLRQQVEEKDAQNEDLKWKLNEALGQNARLAEENSRLQQKSEQAERTRGDTAEMKVKLMQAVDDRNASAALAQRLEGKVEQLEQVIKSMKARAERWQQGELEHKKTLSVLQQKEEEIQQLQAVQTEIRRGHEEAVQQLEAQVRELENQYHSQSEHFNLLSQELERLQTKKSVPTELTKATYGSASMIYPEIWEQETCRVLPCDADTNNEDSASTFSMDALTHLKGFDAQSNSSGSESMPTSAKFYLNPEEDAADETEELEVEKESLVAQSENPTSLRVFLARYSYDPLTGGNEDPEMELPLTAGEYVYIYGEMDEDGFYEGELMDGRRGMVPSNLVEEVLANSLMSFVPTEQSDMNFSGQSSEENSDSPEENRSANLLSNLIKDGIYDDPRAVPYPQNLTLIKQLPRSIIIGWDPPLVTDGWGKVRSYNIYVNADLCQNVKRGNPTRTVIGSLDLMLQTYRISVQSVMDGGNSDKMQCSFLVGNGVPIAPTLLKLWNLTATSAKITWLPSNSNYTHRVYWNETESDVSKPGVYWYTFQNLTPSTTYNIRVETLVPKEVWLFPEGNPEQKSAMLTFTTPSTRLPDAPLDVQVQLAPSAEFLVVNWLPVTIDSAGSSNGVKVTGYAVYISGEKVAEIASPTAGSISLDVSQLHRFQGFQKVSVRTLSLFGESEDSVPALIPLSLSKTAGFSDASSQALELTTIGSGSGDIVETNLATSPKLPHMYMVNPDPNFTIHFSSNCSNSVTPAAGTISDHNIPSSALTPTHHMRINEEGDSILLRSTPREMPGLPFHELSQEEATLFNSFTEDGDQERSPGHWLTKKTKNQPHNSKNKGHVVDKLMDLTAKLTFTQSCFEKALISEPTGFSLKKGNYGDAAIKSAGLQEKPDPISKSKDLKPIQQMCREFSNLTISAAEMQKEQQSRKESCQAGDFNFDLSSIEEDGKCKSRTRLSGHKGSWPHEKPPSPVELPQDNMIPTILRANAGVMSLVPCLPSLPKSLAAHRGQERLFVALYDYDPITMSPNSDGAEKELRFHQGQIIKVTGDKDEDGFYRGECEGRKGYIPCNMVSEMHIESPEVKEQLLKTCYFQDEC